MPTGDKLATRLSLMLRSFNDGARLTVEEMAEEFAVDVRTAQRDLKRLCFLPIERENGRYFLAAYALGKLGYKDLKGFASSSGIGELYPKLDDRQISDILNPKTSTTMKVKGHSYENLASVVDTFNALGGAIIAQRMMAFEYKGKSRQVEPYKLFNTNGIWYLVALEDRTIKHFTLSKISHLSATSKHFEVDEQVVDTIEENNLTWITKDPIEVTLRIDAKVSEYFIRRELLSAQKIIEECEAYLLVSTKVTFEEQILRTVRYWIPHITILSPAHLQEKLEASLQNYLK